MTYGLAAFPVPVADSSTVTSGEGRPVTEASEVLAAGTSEKHSNDASAGPAIVGATFTVNVAAAVVAVLHSFENIARYSFPFSDPSLAVVNEYVVDVAPETFVQSAADVFTCHCTDGAVPLAAALNDATLPEHTVEFDGFDVTAGGLCTVTVMHVPFALPTPVIDGSTPSCTAYAPSGVPEGTEIVMSHLSLGLAFENERLLLLVVILNVNAVASVVLFFSEPVNE